MSPVVFFSCWKWLAQFYFFFKKYPNEAYFLYQPCWAANLSRRGESVCPEMGCTFLKHIKPAISFKYLFFYFEILNYIHFYAWRICWILYWYTFIFKISLNVIQNFGIKNSSDRIEICKVSYNFLTVATIRGGMLTKRRWAPKKILWISKWVVHY